jgi:hypothetical protein
VGHAERQDVGSELGAGRGVGVPRYLTRARPRLCPALQATDWAVGPVPKVPARVSSGAIARPNPLLHPTRGGRMMLAGALACGCRGRVTSSLAARVRLMRRRGWWRQHGRRDRQRRLRAMAV